MQKLKIALVQFAVSQNKELNIERISTFIREAAQRGSNIICLPECFNAPYGIKYFSDYAETIPGFTSSALSASAKENKVYLIGGTFPEKCDEKLYNTCMAFGPDGEILAKFRKIHLFDINIPGKIFFKESSALTAGNSLSMFTIDKWKIGLGICYDVRFPILANIYARQGCQLLVYPGAFNMTTGPAHWELLLKARAADNQLYVAGVSPARNENASYIAWGHSSLISPWGNTVCSMDEKEGIIYGEMDLEYVNEVRTQIPIQMQQRNDIYNIKYHHDV